MGKITNNKFFGGVSNAISQNVASLSMIGGLLAFGGALWAAYKASEGVHKINEEYKEKVAEINSRAISDDKKKAELKDAKGHKITSILFLEKYTIGLAIVGAALEFYSNYSKGVAIAGLSTIVASKQKEIKTWVKNTKESLTAEKFEEIKGKSLEELISENFTTKDGPVMYGTIAEKYSGDLYLDSATGKLFQFRGKDEELKEILEAAEKYCRDYKGLELDKYYNMLGFQLPDGYWRKGMFWGPKNQFRAWIDKQDVLGASIKTILYDFMPVSPKVAGCPFAL